MIRRALLVVTVAGVLLGVVACSGGTGRESTTGSSKAGSSKAVAPDDRSSAVTAAGEQAVPTADPAARTRPTTGVPPAPGRQVVTNATLGLRAKRVGAVADDATTVVTSAGGSLFSERIGAGDRSDATLVFKVPPTTFASVLDRLAGLGTSATRQITTDDVTAQVVDLEGRLASATASTARLRTLFDQAEKVSDVVVIEAELVKREAEVEALQGQLRVVQAQVATATLTVHVVRLVPPPPSAPEDATGFLAGLATGWDALTTAAAAAATAVGVLLPFLVLGALTAAAGFALRRRLRPPAPTTPAP